jgi:glycosyltransferase involved in cell wall biosynthesis
MMKNISICIPFYNTHKLTAEAITKIINLKFISEIIISDDFSKKKFFFKHTKVKIYRNSKNIGALKNKYNAVKLASNDWVYLLDSDNLISAASLKKLMKFNNFNKNFYYSPSKLILQNIDLDKKLDNKPIIYNFPKTIIDFKIARFFLRNNLEYFLWFLNTGNFFINRNKYLGCLEKLFSNNSNNNFASMEADALVFSYFWLKSGNKIKILDFLYYYHRMRMKSYSFHKNNYKSTQKYLYLFKYDNFLIIILLRIWNEHLLRIYNYLLKFFCKKIFF